MSTEMHQQSQCPEDLAGIGGHGRLANDRLIAIDYSELEEPVAESDRLNEQPYTGPVG